MDDPAKTELQELEDIYRNTPVGLCVVDRELRFVRANDEYARTVGHTVEDLMGRSMWDVIPDSARSEAVAMASRVIETGRPVLGLELRRRVPGKPDGDIIWLANIHPVTRNDEVVGAMAVLQNVTSLRQAQEAAAERLRELESIYDYAPVGLAFVDRDLRYLRVNQTLADMNGLSIEAHAGKSYRDISPETADTAEPFLKGLMERGESVRNFEVRSTPPSDPGVEHIYVMSLDPVRNADGEVIGHTSVVRDVTEERRTAEDATRRLKELEILYEHTPVGLCYLDAALRVVHLNPLFAQLTELPPTEKIGAPAEDLLPQAIGSQLLPQLRRVRRSRVSSAPLEVKGRPAGSHSGERTWIVRTHPVLSREREVRGVIVVLEDITQQVDRRKEVEAVRDRLAEAQQIARVGSYDWNLLDDELWWSPELYEIFGKDPSQVPTFVDFVELVHPTDRTKVREQLDWTVENREHANITFQIIRSDGSQRVLFSAARLQRTPSGQPARLTGICQDITEFSPLHAMFEAGDSEDWL